MRNTKKFASLFFGGWGSEGTCRYKKKKRIDSAIMGGARVQQNHVRANHLIRRTGHRLTETEG